MADVGRGAAHVETNHLRRAARFRGAGHADDPAGRAGEDRVLAPEPCPIRKAPARLHEQRTIARPQRGGELVNITAQNWREVRVDQRRIPAPDQLDQWRNFVTYRDLREPSRSRQIGEPRLMCRIAIAMHQNDCDRTKAFCNRGLKGGTGGDFVELLQHRAISHDPLGNLDHPGVRRFGQHNLSHEQFWPFLRADPQCIAKAARDGKHGRLALALKQRVGGNCGAHPNGSRRQ